MKAQGSVQEKKGQGKERGSSQKGGG